METSYVFLNYCDGKKSHCKKSDCFLTKNCEVKQYQEVEPEIENFSSAFPAILEVIQNQTCNAFYDRRFIHANTLKIVLDRVTEADYFHGKRAMIKDLKRVIGTLKGNSKTDALEAVAILEKYI